MQSLTSILSLCNGRAGLDAQRVTASQSSFVDGCPSRRALVLGFLIHSVQKSVSIRGSLSESYSSGVLRHAIRSSPFGERMKVRDLFLA